MELKIQCALQSNQHQYVPQETLKPQRSNQKRSATGEPTGRTRQHRSSIHEGRIFQRRNSRGDDEGMTEKEDRRRRFAFVSSGDLFELFVEVGGKCQQFV